MKYPLIHMPTTQPKTNATAAPPASPSVGNEHFAARLQQNWLSRNPRLDHLTNQAAKDPLDDSLTSLNWLQNMNLNIGDQTPPISPRNGSLATHDPHRVNPNQVLPTNLLTPSPTELKYNVLDPAIQFDKIDYKTNPYIKPPYSYATLICMAMKESKKNKLTLSSIYSWITEHFMYYRMADPSWQNSIRHNLSLNKCFQKVARRKDEPGKGGFWRINPDYDALLDNGVLKKKNNKGELEVNLKRMMEADLDDATPHKRSKNMQDEADQAALSLSEYLNFDRLLNQDISVGGVKLRTEEIIDAGDGSGLVTLSPPSSDDGSSDSFDDLLGAGLGAATAMTVQGTKIEPPEWWAESLNGASFSGLLGNSITSAQIGAELDSHPWTAEKSDIDTAMAALDDMEKFLGSSFN